MLDCFASLAMTISFPHQRIHVLHSFGKILLEFLHYRACRFYAVDQAYSLANKISDEIARASVARRRRAVDGLKGLATDDALQRHRKRARALRIAVPGIGPDRAQLPCRLAGAPS